MRAFIDSSSLFKKYADEPGADEFESILAETSEIAVSPTTWIEMNAAIQRRLRSRSVSAEDAVRFQSEIKKDFAYFMRVLWNESLEAKAVDLTKRHVLKTLDAIQLASAILSESDCFVTSDQKLCAEARKVLPSVRYV